MLQSQKVVAHAFNQALDRQRHADLCEFETSLVYRAISGQSKLVHRETLKDIAEAKSFTGKDNLGMMLAKSI